MVTRVCTVAFQGIEAQPVDVQVMIAPGKMGMHILWPINYKARILLR
jgi:magnesium chelatase family protein